MKTDPNGRIICDDCTKYFGIGERVIHYHLFEAYGIAADGMPMPTSSLYLFFYHESCAPKYFQIGSISIVNQFEDMKNELVNLSDTQRQEIYVLLHNAFGRRI